jgi:hypothetical protein
LGEAQTTKPLFSHDGKETFNETYYAIPSNAVGTILLSSAITSSTLAAAGDPNGQPMIDLKNEITAVQNQLNTLINTTIPTLVTNLTNLIASTNATTVQTLTGLINSTNAASMKQDAAMDAQVQTTLTNLIASTNSQTITSLTNLISFTIDNIGCASREALTKLNPKVCTSITDVVPNFTAILGPVSFVSPSLSISSAATCPANTPYVSSCGYVLQGTADIVSSTAINSSTCQAVATCQADPDLDVADPVGAALQQAGCLVSSVQATALCSDGK